MKVFIRHHIALLFTSITLACFISCSNKKDSEAIKTYTYNGNQVDSIRKENLRTPYGDSIVLGFRFTMSKQDYDYNFSRLIRNKTLTQYSQTDYSYKIKADLLPQSVDALLIPVFENNKLLALKLLVEGTTSATPIGSIVLKKYLTKLYGQGFLSTRSLSELWVKGGLEAEVSRQKIKTDANLSPLTYDVVMFRQTQLALLSHL